MTTETNLYRCSPREVSSFITECFYAGLVPFVRSSPGMGKSSLYRGVAKTERLKMIDHRISTSAPEDFTGLPRFDEDGSARFAPFADLFPIEGTPIPEGYEGWLLFLDEFNQGTKGVQSAAYKLLLDRMTGQHNLHERVCIGLAGNLSTDRALVNEIGTALQSRVVHIEMQINFQEWLEDVALKEGYDHRIVAYLSYRNGALMDFRPDHNEKTFCCPRTWEFMNRLTKGKEITDEKTPLYAGTITSGAAVDFVQYTKVYKDLVSEREILQNPAGARIPTENATKWAVMSHMAELVDDKKFGDFSIYADRFDLTFRILFYRSVMIRKPGLRSHPAFTTAMVALARYLNAPSKLAA